MRVVVDTNIWISAKLKPTSNPGLILNQWEIGNLDIIQSQFLLEEIRKIFSYTKLQKYINLTKLQLDEYLTYIELHSIIVDIDHIKVNVPRDTNDNHVLATLIASNANWLISGDNDLLSLRNEYNIISPSDFIKKYI